MPDYSKGKIYIITSSNGLPYIGSTTETLSERLSKHRTNTKLGKGTTARIHLDADDVKIELLEEYPCKTKQELLLREKHYFDTMECCNYCSPIKSKEEKLDDKHIYYEHNKEKIKKYKNEYYQRPEVIEKIKEYNKKVYSENKVDRNKDHKKWRDENRVIVECPCGSSVFKYKLSDHKRSIKHQEYLITLSLI